MSFNQYASHKSSFAFKALKQAKSILWNSGKCPTFSSNQWKHNLNRKILKIAQTCELLNPSCETNIFPFLPQEIWNMMFYGKINKITTRKKLKRDFATFLNISEEKINLALTTELLLLIYLTKSIHIQLTCVFRQTFT